MTKSARVLNTVYCAKDMHSIGMMFLLYSKGPAPGSIMQRHYITKAREYFSCAHTLMARARGLYKANA